MTADGFKIDGAHFAVTPGANSAVGCACTPHPCRLATMRIQVFHDQMPVDCTYEADAEPACRASPPT